MEVEQDLFFLVEVKFHQAVTNGTFEMLTLFKLFTNLWQVEKAETTSSTAAGTSSSTKQQTQQGPDAEPAKSRTQSPEANAEPNNVELSFEDLELNAEKEYRDGK